MYYSNMLDNGWWNCNLNMLPKWYASVKANYLVGVALLQHLDSDRGVLSTVDNVGGGGLHDLAEGALAKRLLWCPVHQSISFLPSFVGHQFLVDPKRFLRKSSSRKIGWTTVPLGTRLLVCILWLRSASSQGQSSEWKFFYLVHLETYELSRKMNKQLCH